MRGRTLGWFLLAALHTWTAQGEAAEDPWVQQLCREAELVSNHTFEISEYSGVTGCTLALIACTLDNSLLPVLTSLWFLFVCFLAVLQYHIVPLFKDGAESDFVRVFGRGGIVFQLYYATGPGQLLDVFPELRQYSFVLSTCFLFFDAAVLTAVALTLRKVLGQSSSDKQNFSEVIVTTVDPPNTKHLKSGRDETRIYFKFKTVAAYDRDDDDDDEEEEDAQKVNEIEEVIPGTGQLDKITLFIEWKRFHDLSKDEVHMGWPVTVKLDSWKTDDGWVVDKTTGKGYFTDTFHNGEMNFRQVVEDLREEDILVFYKDKEAAPFKNQYMCVPRKFRRCLLYFFVQGGLMCYFVFHLNNDEDTRDRSKLSIVKWLIGLVITAIAGDDESGSNYDWLFWRRMFVNLHDRHTLPCEGARRYIFWFFPVSLAFEWRCRQTMDFIVNALFRAILIGLAPILLCVEDPMDFIKDVLAIFFVVKLDDFDDPRSWTSEDVVEDAVDSKFLGPDVTDDDAVAQFAKEQGRLPMHLLHKRATNLLREIGTCFMYQSPDEAIWTDAFVDYVTWPFDYFSADDFQERRYKKRLRRILKLRADPNDGPPTGSLIGHQAQLRHPILQPHRHRWSKGSKGRSGQGEE